MAMTLARPFLPPFSPKKRVAAIKSRGFFFFFVLGEQMRLQNRPPPLTTSLFTEPYSQESGRTPLTTPVHLNGSTPHSQYSTGFGYSPIPIYHSSGSTDGRTYEQCSNDFLRRASPHSSLYSSPKVCCWFFLAREKNTTIGKNSNISAPHMLISTEL